jgi:predicted transcriptional regulator
METRRTTILLEKELYRQAKRVALEQDKTLKQIVEQALRAYLNGGHEQLSKSREGGFGVYAGRPRGTLKRQSIYRDILK